MNSYLKPHKYTLIIHIRLVTWTDNCLTMYEMDQPHRVKILNDFADISKS